MTGDCSHTPVLRHQVTRLASLCSLFRPGAIRHLSASHILVHETDAGRFSCHSVSLETLHGELGWAGHGRIPDLVVQISSRMCEVAPKEKSAINFGMKIMQVIFR